MQIADDGLAEGSEHVDVGPEPEVFDEDDVVALAGEEASDFGFEASETIDERGYAADEAPGIAGEAGGEGAAVGGQGDLPLVSHGRIGGGFAGGEGEKVDDGPTAG